MKIVWKILLILFGVGVVAVLSALAYVRFRDMEGKHPVEPRTLDLSASDPGEGARIAAMVCQHCHLGSDGTMSGGLVADASAFGEVYAPNITQHPENGIGDYTPGEIDYLIRTGIKRNGGYAPPWMPNSPLLAQSDMAHLIAWLKSDRPEVQPSEVVQPKTRPNMLARALAAFAFQPIPYNDNAPAQPPASSDKIAFGGYLANARYGCYHCHSADFATNDLMVPERSKGFYQGGNQLTDEAGEKITAPNLTPHPDGLGGWSEADFAKALRQAQRQDGTMLRYPMRPYALLADEEISAIYAYLTHLPQAAGN
ncbi:hypothetical protein GC167_06890 [bacterium]|nr:hypothetical protein [bacterium]